MIEKPLSTPTSRAAAASRMPPGSAATLAQQVEVGEREHHVYQARLQGLAMVLVGTHPEPHVATSPSSFRRERALQRAPRPRAGPISAGSCTSTASKYSRPSRRSWSSTSRRASSAVGARYRCSP